MNNYALFDIMELNAKPIETPTLQQWQTLEFEYNIVFPVDYKVFISKYGTGVLAEFFCIWNPFSIVANMNWFKEKDSTLALFKDLLCQFPDFHRGWKLYPTPDGLLPLGTTANGDTLFWITNGNPNNWPIAIAREAPLGIHTENLCSFLHNVLTKSSYSNKLPDLSKSKRVFEPFNLRV